MSDMDFIRKFMETRQADELLLESYSTDEPSLLVEAAVPVHAETHDGKLFIEGLALLNQINKNNRKYICLDETVRKAQQKLKDGHLLGSLTHTDEPGIDVDRIATVTRSPQPFPDSEDTYAPRYTPPEACGALEWGRTCSLDSFASRRAYPLL
jgi:hypothetical protein